MKRYLCLIFLTILLVSAPSSAELIKHRYDYDSGEISDCTEYKVYSGYRRLAAQAGFKLVFYNPEKIPEQLGEDTLFLAEMPLINMRVRGLDHRLITEILAQYQDQGWTQIYFDRNNQNEPLGWRAEDYPNRHRVFLYFPDRFQELIQDSPFFRSHVIRHGRAKLILRYLGRDSKDGFREFETVCAYLLDFQKSFFKPQIPLKGETWSFSLQEAEDLLLENPG